jgi:hypothetical protein
VASTVITPVVRAVIQNEIASVGTGSVVRRSMRVPTAQVAAAVSISSTPSGFAGQLAHFMPQQQRHPQRGRAPTPGPGAGGEPVAEPQRADHGREDRHGVAQDRRAPAGQRLDRHDDASACQKNMLNTASHSSSGQWRRSMRNGTFSTTSTQRQHRQAEPHAQRAEGQGWVVGDAQLHDRPVDAPDQGEHDEDEQLAAGEGMHRPRW